MKGILCFLVAVAGLVASCSKEIERVSTPFDELETLVEQEVNINNVSSIAVGVVSNGELIWSTAKGQSNRNTGEQATDETIYLLASISKTFTSIAIMQLYERGILALDDDIDFYLPFDVSNPHFPNDSITVRMLLSHTSGLAWPDPEEFPSFYSTYSSFTVPELSTWVEQAVVPGKFYYNDVIWKDFRPGTEFQYSNAGMALLGLIVEELSQMPFHEFCKRNIFEPLSMNSTSFNLKDYNLDELAILYSDNQAINQFTVPFYPAGMARSSIEDLSKFVISVLEGGILNGNRILDETTLEQMLAIHSPEMGLHGGGMALGWQGMDDEWIGHLGSSGGSSTSMDLNMERKLGIIILSNSYMAETVYPGGQLYENLHYEVQYKLGL